MKQECEKVRYRSESQARKASKKIAERYRVKRQTVYWCKWCKGWHLTSLHFKAPEEKVEEKY